MQTRPPRSQPLSARPSWRCQLTRRLRPLVALLLCITASAVHADVPIRLLVYGDSNTWGWVPVAAGFPTTRYPSAQRWPEVMGSQLGNGYEIAVDGLSARTTDVDHIAALGVLGRERFNGLRDIDTAVARELPLDLVVIMLGSNDVAADQQRSAERIGAGAERLIRHIRQIAGGVATTYPAPAVLLIAPPPLGQMDRTPIGERFDADSVTKSRQLAAVYRSVAERNGSLFYDASQAVPQMGGIDGIHLTAEQHRALGIAVAAVIHHALPAASTTGHSR